MSAAYRDQVIAAGECERSAVCHVDLCVGLLLWAEREGVEPEVLAREMRV